MLVGRWRINFLSFWFGAFRQNCSLAGPTLRTVYKLLLGLCGLLLFACQPETLHAPAEDGAVAESLSHAEVTQLVHARLVDGDVMRWSAFSDREVYSAGVAGDSLFALGYWADDDLSAAPQQIGLVDVEGPAWRKALDEILAPVLAIESAAAGRALTRAELLVHGEPQGVPSVALRLATPEAVALLRADERVRYLEPMGFDPARDAVVARSSSGCGDDFNTAVAAADRRTVSPNATLPWNYDRHRIEQAWSLSRGDGIGVLVIDSGAGEGQDNLGANFASGESAGGRTVRRVSTLYSGSWWWRRLDGPDDDCGHGTQMSGLACAPRSDDGNAVGVAYRSDLTAVRAVEDVVISSSNESAGVRDALVLAGDDASVRVISMSIGTPLYSSTVADGVYYAANRGKLVLAAAGTSLSWTSWYGVIFPASMPEVVAVTGVRDDYPLRRCNTCHDGSAVEFAIVMQRAADSDRNSLSLTLAGDLPGYIGGSSAATATTAGIAALVWARDPSLSAAQVRERLARSGSNYPNRDGNLGWGLIDAEAAVGDPL